MLRATLQARFRCLLLAYLALAGCATTSGGNPNLLAFLERDPVAKTEVLAHLGEPSEAFEGGQVFTYRLTGGKDGLAVQRNGSKAIGWEGVSYDLVLAFDANGTLQRHNLVAVRP
jgi:hypothetical protein